MACDSIATTISRMGKEPTTIGPEDPLFLFRWAKEVLFLSIYEMASSDAPTLVGKTLIQVISESVNEPRHCHLFYPQSPSPSPPPRQRKSDGWLWRPPPELPNALLHLQNSGHHLQVVWCNSWNARGNSIRIQKDLSVCFSVDMVITSQDIIVGFDKAGTGIDSITSIQRRTSNNSWVVTFDSKAVNDAALSEHSIDIADCSVLLGDCENRVSIAKMYELPDELPHCRYWPFGSLRQSHFLLTRPRGEHHFEWCLHRENFY